MISPQDIDRAADRIRGAVWRTPLIPSPWLSTLTGAEVFLKLELLQRTGSFKMRGAFNALAALRERAPDARAVTTASAGNHGLALATAAGALGFTARVHVPATAPRAKRDGLARVGAEVIEAPTYDAAEAAAALDVARSGIEFISAYSHADVIAGAGTIGREVLEDDGNLDLVVVPVGGGGLISGIAVAAGAPRSGLEIVGAEAEASPVFTAALAAGRPVTVAIHDTLADGLAGNMEPMSQTFGYVRDLVARVERVAEAEIAEAMRGLILHDRVVVEGAAATAAGLLLRDPTRFRGRRIAVILTGRNVDADRIRHVVCGPDAASARLPTGVYD